MAKSIHSAAHQRLCRALRDLRERQDVTQVELAARLQKPQSFVSKYESGERRLDVLELRAVCRALEVPFVRFARELDALLG